MDNVAVQFELRPIDDVVPWGDEKTGLRLHWFGLTDGWYDLIIGGHRLFSLLGETRGIDYPVVRFWEDLTEVARPALKPIPEPLVVRLRDVDAWTAWVDKVWELENRDDVTSAALDWWFCRELTAIHLVGAPRLQLWRVGDELRMRWRSRPPEPDAVVWSSPAGQATTSAAAFRGALTKFDRDLISAMTARVESIAMNWSRPEIIVDVDELRREHADRSMWLEQRIDAPRHLESSWTETIDAVLALEQVVGPVNT